MTRDQAKALLTINELGPFLAGLRETLPPKRNRQIDVADMLGNAGHVCTDATVCRYENGTNQLDSGVQKAYVVAFKLNAKLRLHLQDLAGESQLQARRLRRTRAA